MANLVQVAEELEYVPKEQLIQMSQSPDSRYPQYLVLSEIQRRTQMEKMYNAQEASMNQPQMTVADEVVSNYAQPQGLAGMSANGSANTDAFSPEVAMPAPSSPMQMMAQGGRVGYQNLGYTGLKEFQNLDYGNIDPTMIDPRFTGWYDVYGESDALKRKALLASLNIDASEMSEDEIRRALLFAAQPRDAGGNILRYPEDANISQNFQFVYENPLVKSMNESKNAEDSRELIRQRNIENDATDIDASTAMNQYMNATQDNSLSSTTVEEPIVLFPHGIGGHGSEFNPYTPYTPYSAAAAMNESMGEAQDAVDSTESDISDWISKRYTDPDGTVDWTQAISDASWAIPVGFGAKLGWHGLKGLYGLGRTYGPKALKGLRNRFYARDVNPIRYGKRWINPQTGRTVDQSWRGSTFSQINPNVLRYGFPVLGGIGFLGAQWLQSDKEFQESQQNGENGENGSNDLVNTQKELMDYINTLDQGDLYGSEGTTKKGLAGAGGDDRWLDIAQLGGIVMGARNMSELGAGITALAGNIKDRRAKDRLETIQGDYYESMTEKYRADVKMIPIEQLDSLLTQYQKYAEGLQDGSIEISPEQQELFDLQYRQLLQEAAERQGFDFKTQSEMDADEMAGVVSITG